MELISYAETREYGKKFLANYYIYNNYLNSENKFLFSTIFQSLVSPFIRLFDFIILILN